MELAIVGMLLVFGGLILGLLLIGMLLGTVEIESEPRVDDQPPEGQAAGSKAQPPAEDGERAPGSEEAKERMQEAA